VKQPKEEKKSEDVAMLDKTPKEEDAEAAARRTEKNRKKREK